MKYILSIFFALLISSVAAHNGKLAYAYPTDSKKIDGNTTDWQNENWIEIDEQFGKKSNGPDDISARYKIAYLKAENALYFITEITDDIFMKGDYYEFYFNGIHQKNIAGVASLIFKGKDLLLRIHEKEKDPFHGAITRESILYKTRRSKNRWVIEAKITLPDLVNDYKTIGVDHLIVDIDDTTGEKTYVNWGIGYNGFWKEYNSGQLGDVILLPKQETFYSVSGEILWKNQLKNLQNTVRITNEDYPAFWTEVKTDSTGSFTAELPAGRYYLSPSYPLTNPFAGDGYGNQQRTDIHFRERFEVSSKQVELQSVTFPVFPEPDYLMQASGIIDSWHLAQSPEQLSAFIRTHMSYYNVAGASVAVIKNGEIVYNEVFGVRSNLNKEPITNKTLFQAASVTKSVFAFIVNRLVDQGIFDLDTPLHQLLAFDNYSEDDRYQKITGRMVLNHTTGMPNWAFGGPGGYASNAKGTLLFEPGSKFSYSGEAFEYLARVISKVTGKSINELLHQEVIETLDISPLYFTGNESMELAQGHLQSNATYWGGYATEPGVAHSMLTNASDFAEFIVALTNKNGMSKEQYQNMFQKTVSAPGYPMSPDNNYWGLGMGLGFFVQNTVAGKAVMHGGSNYDFQSEFVLYPESKNGFVIFTNSNTGHKLGQAIGKYLFYGGVVKPSNP